jgi:hypothetical protein
VGDGRMSGEVIDDELPQILGISSRNPYQVIGDSRQVEHHQHPGELPNRIGESIDLFASVNRQADRDQRLKRPPQCGKVDLGVEAANHAALAERAHPGDRRRWRDADVLGDPLIRDPGISREQLEDRTIDGIDGGLMMIRHGAR